MDIIECNEEYFDWSIFGFLYVEDNCGYILDFIVVEVINDCGVGSIIRIWIVIDVVGNFLDCR